MIHWWGISLLLSQELADSRQDIIPQALLLEAVSGRDIYLECLALMLAHITSLWALYWREKFTSSVVKKCLYFEDLHRILFRWGFLDLPFLVVFSLLLVSILKDEDSFIFNDEKFDRKIQLFDGVTHINARSCGQEEISFDVMLWPLCNC